MLIAAVQFQVCIQNRYKLNKKYRKLLPPGGVDEALPILEQRSLSAQARVWCRDVDYALSTVNSDTSDEQNVKNVSILLCV